MKDFVLLHLRLALPFLFATYTVIVSKDVLGGQPDGPLFAGHRVFTTYDEATGERLNRLAVKYIHVTGLWGAWQVWRNARRFHRADDMVQVNRPTRRLDGLAIALALPRSAHETDLQAA